MAKRRTGSSGGVPTNYGYFVQNGVYITFIADLPLKTTGKVISPEILVGRLCYLTTIGWKLV